MTTSRVHALSGATNFSVGIVTLTSIQRREITSGTIKPITQPAERLSHFVNPESTEWPMLRGNLCVHAQRTMHGVCDDETEHDG
jgi:hypothetical protein